MFAGNVMYNPQSRDEEKNCVVGVTIKYYKCCKR